MISDFEVINLKSTINNQQSLINLTHHNLLSVLDGSGSKMMKTKMS